jgi:hypothetical protein
MLLKSLLALSMLSTAAHADVVIGYRGKNRAFDEQAFNDYAKNRKLDPVILDTFDHIAVRSLIKQNNTYELYGYSMGAASVSQTMRFLEKEKLPMPRYILTVGAYYSTDVDFKKYNVPFRNYFDASGTGTKSPGIHIGVSHDAIMRYVTDVDSR